MSDWDSFQDDFWKHLKGSLDLAVDDMASVSGDIQAWLHRQEADTLELMEAVAAGEISVEEAERLAKQSFGTLEMMKIRAEGSVKLTKDRVVVGVKEAFLSALQSRLSLP